jgi:cold shock CspA family protein
MNGTVKWFSSQKGYGFIRGDDGVEYYFNTGSLIGSYFPGNGDNVHFTAARNARGPKATSVSVTIRRPTRSKSIPEAALRWMATDHYGVENAIRTIPGLGFWENLKFVAVKLLIIFLAIILTGVIIFLLVGFGIPWFLFGSI